MSGFGLPRLMLTLVTLRGMSTSATAIQAATISTVTMMFGWCVDDSVFFLLFGDFNGQTNVDAR